MHGVPIVGPSQDRPPMSEVTEPLPTTETLSVPPLANVAVTSRAAFIDTVQVLVPVHAPDHPVNTFETSGVAVSVTLSVAAKVCEHGVPLVGPSHEIPLGFDSTDPFPTTDTFITLSVANVAVTLLDSVM